MRSDPNRGGTRRKEGDGRSRRREAFLAELRRAGSVGPGAPRSAASRAIVPAQVVPARDLAPRASPKPPAAPKAPAPAAPPPARAQMFREQAIRHRLSSEEGRGVVRVAPPWTWAIVVCVVSALGAALTASVVGEVEVTTRGRGILRPAGGVRALASQATGTVTRVEARSGEAVRAGAPLLRIESPDVEAQVLEADRQLEALRTRFAGVAAEQDRHYAEQLDSLRARARRTEDQIASLRGSARFQERRVAADAQLLAKGLLSELAAGEGREALAQAQRQLSGAEQGLDQTRQELASLEARRQDELWQRQQALDAAKSRRDSLALLQRQSVVPAPEDGTVEALSVRVGEAVRAGQVVGKLIPAGAPLHVVAFLAERDRAFAKPGDEVRLELDGLPHAEYGTLRARIARIGDDLAAASEIRDALGEEAKLEAPSYRVELEITDATAAEAARVKLRTGALMDVRYTLRRQKLAALVFNPLRRFFR